MKSARPTLTALKRNWWWHKRATLRLLRTRVAWPDVEEAARNYELARRSSKGKRQFVTAYPDLGYGQTLVHCAWPSWSPPVRRIPTRREEYQEIGWTPVYEYQQWQWNLRAADKHLIDEFIREIRLLREIQKIEAPHPLKGKKYRGVSWKLVEILDRVEAGAKSLDDSDRHTLSKARQLAEQYFVEFTSELEKRKAQPDPFADLRAEELADDEEEV